MTDYAAIYESQAAQYERLIAREDHEGHILPAIAAVRPLAGIDVVELGAGTGRLTRLLAPHVGSIRAFDASPAMLDVAREVLVQGGFANWHLEVADHRSLPVADESADLVLGGWTICYAALWSKGRWEADLDAVLAEMGRVLRPGGSTRRPGADEEQAPMHFLLFHDVAPDDVERRELFRTEHFALAWEAVAHARCFV